MILPERAGTDGPLEVREWRTEDADAMAAAINASRTHLARWMDWAGEPDVTAAICAERIHGFHQRRLAGGEALYGMFLDDRPVGGCGLHDRLGLGGLEIGYWVHVDFLRRGFARTSSRLLTDLAFAQDAIDRVEIHHDAANLASGAVPASLGFHLVGESPRPHSAPADAGIERRWRLSREEWLAWE